MQTQYLIFEGDYSNNYLWVTGKQVGKYIYWKGGVHKIIKIKKGDNNEKTSNKM